MHPHATPRAATLALALLTSLASAACGDSPGKPTPDTGTRGASSRASATSTTASTTSATSASASASATGSASASATGSASAAPSGGPASSASGSASAAASSSPTTSALASASAAPTASVEAPPVVGAEKGGGEYGAWLQAAGSYKAGETGAVTVVLVAKGDYHCNEKYPYKLKLDPPAAGLSYPAPIARGMSIGAKRSTMSVAFTPSQPGSYTISGTFYFSVCTDASCKIDQVPLAVAVKVQ
ncbi:MAG: hypothetical protein HY908_29475 [Myxococcales bacterium]|nr:hypothetical protein [Myxococcales bacterium]